MCFVKSPQKHSASINLADSEVLIRASKRFSGNVLNSLLFSYYFTLFLVLPLLFYQASSFWLAVFLCSRNFYNAWVEQRTKNPTVLSEILISFHVNVLQLHFSSYILFAVIFFLELCIFSYTRSEQLPFFQ